MTNFVENIPYWVITEYGFESPLGSGLLRSGTLEAPQRVMLFLIGRYYFFWNNPTSSNLKVSKSSSFNRDENLPALRVKSYGFAVLLSP